MVKIVNFSIVMTICSLITIAIVVGTVKIVLFINSSYLSNVRNVVLSIVSFSLLICL